jgi:hypothetical protein
MKKLIKKLKHHLFLYKGSKNYATYIPERSDIQVTTVARGHYSIITYNLIPIKIFGIHVWYKMEPISFNMTTLFAGSKMRVASVESKKCEDGRTIKCYEFEPINQ